MRLLAVFAVTTLSGYIALSYEIVWVRIYDFLTKGRPEAFGYLLGAYLTGLACGAFFARRYCDSVESPGARAGTPERAGTTGGREQLHRAGVFLLTANVAAFLVVPAVAGFARLWGQPTELALPIFACVAALLGTSLPLVAHFAIPPDDEAGTRLSYLYVGNILGSAAGSLTTGFVLLDRLSLRGLAVSLALLGVAVSGVLILSAPARARCRLLTAAALAALAVGIVSSSSILYDAVYEKLLYEVDFAPDERFVHVHESTSGIVTVSADGTLYGGGSYDGAFNTSPLPDRDVNRVVRAYAIAALHPHPKDVLMIGLGTGSWTQVLANHPDVESVTVVEIDPGYVDMLRHYQVVASVRDNPKVTIVVDDGRRYVQRTRRRFDVIVQNTIAYWRAHVTNLLSREHLELLRRHLKEGGILYYNTTASTAAQRTGAIVFPYVWRFQNMLVASDSPITIDRERWQRALAAWRIDGQAVIDGERQGTALERIVHQEEWRGQPAWEDRASILRRTEGAPVITEDNMATEWWAFETYP